MRIAICDDITIERNTLKDYIYSFACAEVLDYVIEEYESAQDLLMKVEKSKVFPDILFMDIYMSGINGMEAVKHLKEQGFVGSLLFTTTSTSHAVESYKLMADGYLVKPYTKEEFNQNFKQAISNYTKHFKTISFFSERLTYKVFLKDLEFVEVATRGCLLHVKGEIISTTKTLVEFDKELINEDCFLRCHRSCIVNLNYVAQVEEDYILMKNGAKAPLTLKERPAIKRAVFDYFFLKMRRE